jgi:hypothetical protein
MKFSPITFIRFFPYAFQDEMGPINPQQFMIFVLWNFHKIDLKIEISFIIAFQKFVNYD